MSFDFPFVRLFGVRQFCYYPYLAHVCYYSFCFEILMIHVFFFQMYKYVLKDILLFMSYLISLHMKTMFHSKFLFLLITLTSLK